MAAVGFQQLTAIPAAANGFANIEHSCTRLAYQIDLEDFCSFVDLVNADEFGMVTRSHVLAWWAQLETRGLAGTNIRRKLPTLASLFDHLLESNAIAGGNPVHGVKRPWIETDEGKTPAQAITRLRRCSMHPMPPH